MLATLLPTGTAAPVELDVQERDRYGRTLAYLYAPDGRAGAADMNLVHRRSRARLTRRRLFMIGLLVMVGSVGAAVGAGRYQASLSRWPGTKPSFQAVNEWNAYVANLRQWMVAEEAYNNDAGKRRAAEILIWSAAGTTLISAGLLLIGTLFYFVPLLVRWTWLQLILPGWRAGLNDSSRKRDS